jgi:WD40 repeat protein
MSEVSSEPPTVADAPGVPAGLSRFYTSTFGGSDLRDDRSTSELMAEAVLVGQHSWPPGSRYRVEEAVAIGGMGAILRAYDTQADRDVAMKVLLRGDADSPGARRFLREARIVASLEHPNIVPVHDIGRSPLEEPYFTMKLVHGEALADALSHLRHGDADYEVQYDLTRLLTIFQHVCDAVAFAHSRGIVHLDLKPHNLLIGAFGEVVVLDWGLARAMTDTHVPEDEPAPPPQSAAGEANAVTREGTVKGTPGFMAPEQAHGHIASLDERTDVFALGAILYSMLTLKSPIVGASPSELLQQTITGGIVPPGRRIVREVPSQLEAVVMKALALEPADRYGSVAELQADIDAYLAGHATSFDAGLWSRALLFLKRHSPLARATAVGVSVTLALVLAIVLLLGLVADARRSRRTAEADARRSVAAAQAALAEHLQTCAAGQEEVVAARTETRHYAYVSKLHLADLCLADARFGRAAGLLDACALPQRHWEWRWLRQRAALQATVPAFTDAAPAARAVFSGDGARLAVALADGSISIRRAADGVEVVRLPGAGKPLRLLALDRQGQTLVGAAADSRTMRAWDVRAARPLRVLNGHRRPVTGVAITADGETVISAGADHTIVVWNLAEGRPARVLRGHSGPVTAVAVSPSGDRVLSGGTDRTVRLWDAASGRQLSSETVHRQVVTSVALAPTRQRGFSADAGGRICVWRLDTGALEHQWQTTGGGRLTVSADAAGTRLCTVDGDRRVRWWDTRTGTVFHELRQQTAAVSWAQVSPDGDQIVTVDVDDVLAIWHGLQRSEIRRLPARGGIRALAVAADGGEVAIADPDGAVVIRELESGALVDAFPGGAASVALAFTADGRHIVCAHADGTGTVRVRQGNPPPPRVLRGHAGRLTAVAASSDRIVTGGADGTTRVWDVAGALRATFRGDAPVAAVAIADDGRHLVTADNAGNLRVASAADDDAPVRALSVAAVVRCLQLRADRLVAGLADGTLQVWSWPACEPLSSRQVHPRAVSAVALPGHRDPVMALVLAGDRLLSADRRGTILVRAAAAR